ncbi:hypothetical protein MYCTH_2308822 [Thermothelomyces thermophilus ATCC 42464]|uniref:Uncharacterized protein n=1 Tax=Thermothelomyces thermophilus (strain ATCC 42464 / BCRC 31852 / DSM 1799) TaxID=573729 RepID=G2QKB8_THET4|nr:uncharacterized protein MYCTH_2308822 [Thermothelomyces thermophilus ATCC 42464]AEO60024.1 hypothetical protein MYCTH_2308822 [Thermothelomyces thermophilus ATCC 42464]
MLPDQKPKQAAQYRESLADPADQRGFRVFEVASAARKLPEPTMTDFGELDSLKEDAE